MHLIWTRLTAPLKLPKLLHETSASNPAIPMAVDVWEPPPRACVSARTLNPRIFTFNLILWSHTGWRFNTWALIFRVSEYFRCLKSRSKNACRRPTEWLKRFVMHDTHESVVQADWLDCGRFWK